LRARPSGSLDARNALLDAAPEHAFVVLAVPGGDVEATVARLAARDESAEIVIVRQGQDEGDVFPLGTCYARNRGADATIARTLIFVDSADERPPLEFGRAEFRRAGGFDHALGFATRRGGPHDAELADRLGRPAAASTPFARVDAIAAGRVARRLRSVPLALRAIASGGQTGLLGRDRWRPPDPAPHLPLELHGFQPLVPIGASNPAKTHFLYSSGGDTIVHLYVNPTERLRRALGEREEIRNRAGSGVPTLQAVVDEVDCVWVVEERLRGLPPAAQDSGDWFPRVADWLLRLRNPDGHALSESTAWHEHVEAVRTTTPAPLAAELDHALAIVGRLPSVAMHGDLQRKNVLLDGASVGAVDWEGAWLDGIPGLDLMFLAMFASSEDPDFSVLESLLAGTVDLRTPLARLGIEEAALPAALLVMLATWALSEGRRRARLGAPPPPAVFAEALLTVGSRLAR